MSAPAPAAAAYIRRYNPATDRPAIIHICEATAHHSLKDVVPLLPYLYAIPYVDYCPQSAFVLCIKADDSVVGYAIGTPDTAAFIETWTMKYVETLPEDLRTRYPVHGEGLYDPSKLMYRDFLKQWPAHLHIDILPDWTGKGWGSLLMNEFLRELRDGGAGGVYLGMADDNLGALRFYERKKVEKVQAEEGCLWMARSLDK